MKLSHALTLVGLGLGTLGLVASQGCSSSTSSPTGGGLGGPPGKPSAGKTTSTEEHNYALHVLYMGDTDRAGVASPTAWKNIGYNLDGKVTTKDSTDVCTLAAGAPKSTQVDGANGIDNSFGENILPIVLTTAGTDASKRINDSINSGGFTVMLDITGLSDSDPAQTATGLTGLLLAGGKFNDDVNIKPTWTKADVWPVRPELLTSPTDPKSSSVKFPDAFVVNGTFVNGSPADLTLSLAIGGVSLDIKIHQAVITFDHKAPGKATSGTIAGVIQTGELISALQKVAGRIATSLCQGQAFESIAQQIRQASDIMANGTNAAGVACDGISIGLGFTADEIGIPSKVAGLGTPTPDPCTTPPDAGAPDTGSPPDAGSPQDSGGGG